MKTQVFKTRPHADKVIYLMLFPLHIYIWKKKQYKTVVVTCVTKTIAGIIIL